MSSVLKAKGLGVITRGAANQNNAGNWSERIAIDMEVHPLKAKKGNPAF